MKTKFFILVIILYIMLSYAMTGCKKDTPEEEEPLLLEINSIGSVYDFDNNEYKLIVIGKQGWLQTNLKAIHYSNGDTIPHITGNDEWANTTQGAWCDYKNDSQHAKVYGHLYNWHAAHDTRNICPEGFHVPTNNDWNLLIDYLGGWGVAGGKVKEKGTDHWSWPNNMASNSSGFTALPGGGRLNGGVFGDDIGTYAGFWSSSNAPTSGFGYGVGLTTEGENISDNDQMDQSWGLSVRCIQNSGNNEVIFIDPRNAQVYKTLEFGDQTWMAENLNINIAGSWVYKDDISLASTWGRLYDFESARNACPEGWHLPDTAEWNRLINYLGGYWVAGGTMKEAGTDHWDSPNYGAFNGSGFGARAAGCRIPDSYPTDYYYLKVFANFWTASEYKYDTTQGAYVQLDYQSTGLRMLADEKNVGYSVRCIKNK